MTNRLRSRREGASPTKALSAMVSLIGQTVSWADRSNATDSMSVKAVDEVG